MAKQNCDGEVVFNANRRDSMKKPLVPKDQAVMVSRIGKSVIRSKSPRAPLARFHFVRRLTAMRSRYQWPLCFMMRRWVEWSAYTNPKRWW